jgi:threonine 3-dehydrogenase
MSGQPSSAELALEAARPGARISLLGLYADRLSRFDMNAAIFKGLRIQGIVGRRLWETWDQMHDLLVNRGLDVSAVITHEMPYTEIARAFEILEKGEAGKIVLTFPGA